MKRRVFFLLPIVLALAGCDSLSDATQNVRAKIAARSEPRQVRDFSAPSRAAYEAVRTAAHAMGFQFLRGGAAQGEFEAVNSVAPGETSRSARQIAMKVRLHGDPDGATTEIGVLFTEIIEADSTNRASLATETPLPDGPQYETFFREVQRALDAQKKS